jgi:DNA-binding transcriptional ArsR family regulator
MSDKLNGDVAGEESRLAGALASMLERLEKIEGELADLRSMQKGGLVPPRDLTGFEAMVNASLGKAEPMFKDLTVLMEKELAKSKAKGIALLGGLYEDPTTGLRAWWVSKRDIELLLGELGSRINDVSGLASCLSGPQRLQILADLCHGPRRFSDLSRITGVRGGQLTHHLQPLTRLGLVGKEHDSYAITNKGWKSLHAILLAGLTNEPPRSGSGGPTPA